MIYGVAVVLWVLVFGLHLAGGQQAHGWLARGRDGACVAGCVGAAIAGGVAGVVAWFLVGGMTGIGLAVARGFVLRRC